MKKILLLFSILFCLFLTGAKNSRPGSGGDDYRIYIEKSDNKIEYKVNDFYSVYYVYMNVIRALDINDRLGRPDIEKLISVIIDNLKKSDVVQLQLDNHKGSGTLRVTLRTDVSPKAEKPILLVVSNYNAATKRVVSGDDQKDAYATFFYIMRKMLVKNRYIHEPKSESELEKMTVNNRADYYLLDGEPENDAVGRALLEKEIKSAGDASGRALLYMTLSEYDLLSGRAGNAKKCLEQARALIGGLKDEKKKASLLNVLQYANDLYKYYVDYTGR